MIFPPESFSSSNKYTDNAAYFPPSTLSWQPCWMASYHFLFSMRFTCVLVSDTDNLHGVPTLCYTLLLVQAHVSLIPALFTLILWLCIGQTRGWALSIWLHVHPLRCSDIWGWWERLQLLSLVFTLGFAQRRSSESTRWYTLMSWTI